MMRISQAFGCSPQESLREWREMPPATNILFSKVYKNKVLSEQEVTGEEGGRGEVNERKDREGRQKRGRMI